VAPELTVEDRLEQRDLILSEVERLTRLFQNILEMARIDAGAVTTEMRRTHPSEILAAARDQVEHTLRTRRVNVEIADDLPVRLDPRVTAAALAHVLENAAQYSPQSRSRVDAPGNSEGGLGPERRGAARASLDAGCAAEEEDRTGRGQSEVPRERALGGLPPGQRAILT
jgi:signal transduction histidine kinase